MSAHKEPPEDRAHAKRLLKELIEMAGRISQHSEPQSKITVNKQTPRFMFENETEDQVTIIIERRKD